MNSNADLTLHPKEVELWFDSVSAHEAPLPYTRWAALFGAAASAEQRVYLPSAHMDFYPNIMLFFVGPPASRKSTVIRYLRSMLFEAGKTDFCPQDITKAALLRELQGKGKGRKLIQDYSAARGYIEDPFDVINADSVNLADMIDADIEQKDHTDTNATMTVLADELQTQFQRPHEVISLLQDLYDGKPLYTFRSGNVYNPCINMLSAVNTETLPVLFDHAKLLQGLLSRIILIHAPVSGRRFNPFLARGKMPAIEPMAKLYRQISKMKGEMYLSDGAIKLYEKIEMLPKQLTLTDARFTAYTQRRSNHVVKIAMCQALLRLSYEISALDIAYAHTLLCYTESHMPEALGEYGFSKMSNAQQAVLNALNEATLSGNGALTISELFPRVQHYVGTMDDLAAVLVHLSNVKAIKKVGDDIGTSAGDTRIKYVRVKADLSKWSTQFNITVFPQLMPEWANLIGA